MNARAAVSKGVKTATQTSSS